MELATAVGIFNLFNVTEERSYLALSRLEKIKLSKNGTNYSNHIYRKNERGGAVDDGRKYI